MQHQLTNFIKNLKGGKNNTNLNFKGNGKTKFDGNCNFCKKYGHMEKNCWDKQRDQKGKGKRAQNVNDDIKGKGPKEKNGSTNKKW